ncbi:hypothetical protein [Neisseria iguanae]|uniref:Uncharacterized protein n=1 Tax=Neisseria iguanae TaxID=90242 RepID=A0A2P7TZ62_9NEIS|nr:hypothetical protein [Neisseria iguanae]PSJ79933.1 hypothetical protein C7N83_09300 [Neisseria iguanae]
MSEKVGSLVFFMRDSVCFAEIIVLGFSNVLKNGAALPCFSAFSAKDNSPKTVLQAKKQKMQTTLEFSTA